MPEASIAEKTLSSTEILDAIDRMSIADGQRLLKTAAFRCYGTGLDAEDLFQEAMKRALQCEDGRRCPRDVTLVVFLAGAIRSVADAERKKRARERVAHRGKAIETENTNGAAKVTMDLDDFENEAENKRMVDSLFSLLEGDEKAQLVLLGDLEGLSAAEIRAINGLSKTDLATVRTQTRRTIKKAYPKGWTP